MRITYIMEILTKKYQYNQYIMEVLRRIIMENLSEMAPLSADYIAIVQELVHPLSSLERGPLP